MLECAASVMIAIEPVIAPAAIFSAIRIELDSDRDADGAQLPRRLGLRADGAGRSDHRGASSISARAARPRWLIASFSSALSSAIVRPSS